MRFNNVIIETLSHHFSDTFVSSSEIEDRLSPVYDRLKLPYGRLELQTGIETRSMWPVGTKASSIATDAAVKCFKKSQFEKSDIDLLIHASVCRDFLEPATASVVHDNLNLKSDCIIFDLSNACLGVLSGIIQASAMIEQGLIKTAMIVSGENGGPLLEDTIKFLNTNTELTRKTIKKFVANLTIGSAGCAVIISNKDIIKTGLVLDGAVTMSDTASSKLCQGDGNADSLMMQTESEELLQAGVKLAGRAFSKLKEVLEITNSNIDRVICHQIGTAHRKLLLESLDIEIGRDFSSFKTYGNTGSAALPTTLSMALDNDFIKVGDTTVLLGIGSGLNSTMLGVSRC
jgi:3-oxoacyl-[acyl-carrier-protein] synthase III